MLQSRASVHDYTDHEPCAERATLFISLLMEGLHTTRSLLMPRNDNQASLLASVMVPLLGKLCHPNAHFWECTCCCWLVLGTAQPNSAIPSAI